MDQARILHFDDDESLRKAVGSSLGSSRHTVVASAATTADAFALLDEVHQGKLQANTVLLDGQISNAHGDPLAIIGRIQELGLPLFIIGLATQPMTEHEVEVDVDLTKENIAWLEDVLDNLPEPA